MTIEPRLLVVLLVAPLMNAQDRMPPIPADQQSDAQKKAVSEYQALRKTDLAGPPWSVLLRVPDLVVPSLELRLHNLNNSALNRKLTEFAILIAARHWTNNFEWNAHNPLAISAGLSAAVIAAIADGRRPTNMAEDDVREAVSRSVFRDETLARDCVSGRKKSKRSFR